MIKSISLTVPATIENFDEDAYVAANPDIRSAIKAGMISSGQEHFDAFGKDEKRDLRLSTDIISMREKKMSKLIPLLLEQMDHTINANTGSYNFLTEQLRNETRIIDTELVSSNNYDDSLRELVEQNSDGIVLDCGSGRRNIYFENVVNFEIADYDTTDILGVGEHLPFKDNSFDGVISNAVLEHVRDPFKCADEISRVLKPGGTLLCSVPFLQPVHGYPHHYFNATQQGLRRLFEDKLEVQDVWVPKSLHPIWSLHWILNTWRQGLQGDALKNFDLMTVAELANQPIIEQLSKDYNAKLPESVQSIIASGSMLRATKKT